MDPVFWPVLVSVCAGMGITMIGASAKFPGWLFAIFLGATVLVLTALFGGHLNA